MAEKLFLIGGLAVLAVLAGAAWLFPDQRRTLLTLLAIVGVTYGAIASRVLIDRMGAPPK